MRIFYTFLFYLLLPLILLRLYWRGIKAPEYRKRWLERLAIYPKKFSQQVIWIHAVSVGEAEAVFPLVKRLQIKFPGDQFLITTTTPTGSARVQAVLGESVFHVYLPYDLPHVINRFLTVFKPKIAIIMEKEIWPNIFFQCATEKIPLMIINARLSANSAKGYKKIPALVQPALKSAKWISTQTKEDRLRFVEIGATKKLTRVDGNIKFDIAFDNILGQQALDLKLSLFKNRFVWIIASTHELEEDIFFEIYPQLKKQIPTLLLMIVPRHPERFLKVKLLAEKMGLVASMRSSSNNCSAKTDVYIADTMGELKMLYGAADVCFVGGSMVPVGGHNILEPASMNTPIMFGPHMVNFKDIAKNVLELDAAIQCQNKDELIAELLHLHQNSEFRMDITSKAKKFLKQNQGATERVMVLVKQVLNGAQSER